VTRTPELVDALVECAIPVRRLRRPLVRAWLWLAFAGLILALLAIGHGVRGDLVARLHQPRFAMGIAAALLTGIVSAITAFVISMPDCSRRWLLLPAPAITIWISTISHGCLTDWVSVGPDGMHLGEAARCLATVFLTSVPLSVTMLVMLRHAALLRADAVAFAGGIAVAAITSTALSLFHNLDATVMILVWNVGATGLITLLGTLIGRRFVLWVSQVP